MPLTLYKTFALQIFASLRFFTSLVYVSTYCVPIAYLRQNKPFPLLYLGHAQIISRVRFVFSKELLETIINALVFGKLYYFSSVWSSTSACNGNVKKCDHISPVLRNLGWLPVKTRLYCRDGTLTLNV